MGSPQTGPVVGISFCLIIVRLGSPLPEVQDEDWHVSFRTPPSKSATSDQIAVSLAQFKIQRNESVSGPRECHMELETSVPQAQMYVDSSDDLPKVFRHSLSPSTHTRGTHIRSRAQ